MIGKIHSFETFGTVDGPGIRFVIFVQGCMLKCKYCHNRDTWDLSSGKYYSVQEIVNLIKKYRTYYESSKGGVTISGGEPLIQQVFVLELLKELKKENFHTAIDTSGNFNITPKLEEILNYTDLVLLDIKQINDEKSIDLTGYSNKKTLEFARYLDKIGKPVWIRHVFVPTYSDDPKDIKKLKNFINSLNNVEKIEILPYHDMGKHKWEELGEKYELEHITPPTKKYIKEMWNNN